MIAEGALDITDFAVKLFFWNYILYNWKCAKFDRLALLVLYLKVLYFTVEVVYISEKRIWKRGGGELPLVLDELAGCVSETDAVVRRETLLIVMVMS